MKHTELSAFGRGASRFAMASALAWGLVASPALAQDAATDGDGSCIYADTECEVCNDYGGVDPIDSDGDSVLDCVEVVGCQNQEACNYSPEATDPGECHYLSYVESGC